MSDECRLEEWAESIPPSKICAQLQGTLYLAMAILVSGAGWNTGGSNSGMVAASPR